MTPEIAGILVYIIAQLAIGVWVSRRIASESDYLLAGRSLGLGLATFSIFATWFGAETCIGSSGAIFDEGISGGRADPFGYAICLLLMGLFFAARLRTHGFTTLPDLFRERFGARTEALGALTIAVTSLIWAAAQVQAFATVLSAITGATVDATLLFGAAVVILYTTMGGLRADVITDFVQGIAIAVGLTILFAIGLAEVGGPSAAWDAIPSERLTWFPDSGDGTWSRIDQWAVAILGSLTAQELAARVLACRTPSIARNGTLSAAGVYLVVGLLPVALALVGPQLVAGLENAGELEALLDEDGERILPLLARAYLPTFLYVLFAGAILSAILSTVDSTLLAVSALVSHNLVFRFVDPANERRRLRISRSLVVAAGVGAYLLARFGGGVYDLVMDASSFGTPGLLVIAVFGLFTRFGRAWAGLAALLAAIALSLAFRFVVEVETPFLISLVASACAFVLAATAEVFCACGGKPAP